MVLQWGMGLFFGDVLNFWRKKRMAYKAKRLTRREIISQIEALSSGESVSYPLAEVHGNNLAMVEFNTGSGEADS